MTNKIFMARSCFNTTTHSVKRLTLLFLLPIGLCLALGLIWRLMLYYVRPLLMKEYGPAESFRITNYVSLILYLIDIFIIIFIFYLIGMRINLKENLLSSAILLFAGFYVGDVINNLLFLHRIFSLTMDFILATLVNTLLFQHKFFIAFTGLAIGYIRAFATK